MKRGKERLKKEFPELFEVKLEVGRWYINKKLGESIFCVTKIKDGNVYAFGLDYLGYWKEEKEWTNYESHPSRKLATKEEIETMLWKEAEKRGIGEDTKLEFHADNNEYVFKKSFLRSSCTNSFTEMFGCFKFLSYLLYYFINHCTF